jgi:hypothetical protein
MIFPFLEHYKLSPELITESGAKSIGRLRHNFFALPEFQIREALTAFNPFPEELKSFYEEIGFGFMHRAKLGKINILFDPMSLIYTNQQRGYFATPETADALKYYNIEKHLLFFKTTDNQYLAIERETVKGKNKIYYNGDSFEDSLYDFLKHFDFNRYYLPEQLERIIYLQEKKQKKLNKPQEKKKVKYIGGHILIDRY